MKKKKAKNQPIDGVDRFFGALGGGFVGGLVSILAFIILSDNLPAEGILGYILGVLPGVVIGVVLGLAFPRRIIEIADAAFLGL